MLWVSTIATLSIKHTRCCEEYLSRVTSIANIFAFLRTIDRKTNQVIHDPVDSAELVLDVLAPTCCLA